MFLTSEELFFLKKYLIAHPLNDQYAPIRASVWDKIVTEIFDIGYAQGTELRYNELKKLNENLEKELHESKMKSKQENCRDLNIIHLIEIANLRKEIDQLKYKLLINQKANIAIRQENERVLLNSMEENKFLRLQQKELDDVVKGLQLEIDKHLLAQEKLPTWIDSSFCLPRRGKLVLVRRHDKTFFLGDLYIEGNGDTSWHTRNTVCSTDNTQWMNYDD